MMVGLKRISSVLGLLASMTSAALAQETAPTTNQMTADAVAGSLRMSRNLEGYRIEIQTNSGLVTLKGTLAYPAQKAEAIYRAQQVAGVNGVIDELKVSNDTSVRPVQYQPNQRVAYRQGMVSDTINGGIPTSPAIGGTFNGGMSTSPITYNGGITTTQPMTSAPISYGSIGNGGPVPEGPAGMTGATQASQPGMPNYAWPSYAPYPNFSAVGYPTAYPWQAWPNIGPFYPYPEVPLDWRAVTLRWDDGIWWLDFKKHYTRPFFTPYPFGLFAY
jgi:hypothetical protein